LQLSAVLMLTKPRRRSRAVLTFSRNRDLQPTAPGGRISGETHH
jgi:hypothetical protein